MLSKPAQSKITLTDYSKISVDDKNCDSINPLADHPLDQFPISLKYKTDDASLQLTTDNDFFEATLVSESSLVDLIF